jgi:hypothetical protein
MTSTEVRANAFDVKKVSGKTAWSHRGNLLGSGWWIHETPKPSPSAIQLHWALSPTMIPTFRRDFHGARLGIVPSTKMPEGELEGTTSSVVRPATVGEPHIGIIESLRGLQHSGGGTTVDHFLDSMIFSPAVSLVLKESIVASQSFNALGEQRCRNR